VGGFCGSLVAGWASDRLFGARRGPVNVIFAFGMLISLFLFWIIPAGFPILDSMLMFCVGFAIFGPQMLIGIAVAEFSHKKAVATSTGFVGFFAYMGAATAGYPIGKILQDWGWDGYFLGMAVCCLFSILFLIPLWNVTKHGHATEVASPRKVDAEVEYA